MGFYVVVWLPRFRNVVLLCFRLVAPNESSGFSVYGFGPCCWDEG